MSKIQPVFFCFPFFAFFALLNVSASFAQTTSPTIEEISKKYGNYLAKIQSFSLDYDSFSTQYLQEDSTSDSDSKYRKGGTETIEGRILYRPGYFYKYFDLKMGENYERNNRKMEYLLKPDFYSKISKKEHEEETVFSTSSKPDFFPDLHTQMGVFSVLIGNLALDHDKRESIDRVIKTLDNSETTSLDGGQIWQVRGIEPVSRNEMIFRFSKPYDGALTFLSTRQKGEPLDLTRETEAFFEMSQFEQVENTFFPRQLKFGLIREAGTVDVGGQDVVYHGGSVEDIYEFKNIVLNRVKPEDFESSFSVPDGTRVFVLDVPQIEYIWKGGKILPKTDELMLEIARGDHTFMPYPNESRFWLIALGVLMILVGGGFKLRQYLKSGT